MPDELSRTIEMFARVIRTPHASLTEEQALGRSSAREEKRLLAYRKLIRGGILASVRAELERTAERIGPAFAIWIDRWLDEELPRSQYVRDLADELLAWAEPRWRADQTLPPYISDFARHEAALFATRAERKRESTGLSLTLHQGVLFDAPTRLARYDYAVHEVLDTGEEPRAQRTELLLYRDRDHEARWLLLTPLAAAILERLLQGDPLGRAITDACTSLGFVLQDSVLRGTSEMLADLSDKGVLLGALDLRANEEQTP